ncbi:MAG: PqqD family protein [Oscillospiraceae bacterium]|nr:PqqD family protein [Oscillospiraceae bacterium]
MKIVDGFILKSIVDTNIVVPVGSNSVSFNAIISLNDSGAFLWKQLENEQSEESLLAAMLAEYDVDEATAKADIREFLNSMRQADLLK